MKAQAANVHNAESTEGRESAPSSPSDPITAPRARISRQASVLSVSAMSFQERPLSLLAICGSCNSFVGSVNSYLEIVTPSGLSHSSHPVHVLELSSCWQFLPPVPLHHRSEPPSPFLSSTPYLAAGSEACLLPSGIFLTMYSGNRDRSRLIHAVLSSAYSTRHVFCP